MILSRGKILLLALPVVILLMVSVPVWWLLHTASGAAWVWNRVQGLDAVEVRAARVTGDLASGLVFEDLAYRSDAADVSVRRAELQAGPGWWPLSVEVRKLTLLDTDVLLHAAGNAAEPAAGNTDAGSLLAGLAPPVPVNAGQVELNNIVVRREDGLALARVDSVSFGASLGNQLLIDHLEIVAPGFESRIRASLALAEPFELSVDADNRLEYPVEFRAEPLVLPFRLLGSGNLGKLKLGLTSPATGLQLDGVINDPLDRAQWDLRANLDHIALPEDFGGQDITLSDISLEGQGDLNEWSFDLGSKLQEGQSENTRVAIAGTGTPGGVEITGATFTGDGLDLDVSGKLDWSEQLRASVTTVIRRLDLSPWVADWPAGDFLAGELELEWSGQGLKVPKGRLGIDGTRTSVDFAADVDIAAETVNARLNWNHLAWPPKGSAAVFTSRSGRLDVSGGITDWRANGQLDIQLGEYPRGRFGIEGGGGRTSARFRVAEGEILGGGVRGEVGADWSGDLAWDAAINAHGIDPGPILSDWPGKLDGDIRIESGGQPQRTRIDIASLQGLLRGVPVKARGGIEITDSGLSFESLDVNTDDAQLRLDGVMSGPDGVIFSFDGELPSMLLQGARGKARVEGRYSDAAAHPLLELEAHAVDLAWNGIDVGTLAISTSGTSGAEPPPVLQLDATSVSWQDVRLDTLSLAVNPEGDQYRVDLAIAEKDVVLNSVVMMTPGSPGIGLDSDWRGLLSRFDVDVGPAYSFGLQQPAAFTWSSSTVSMQPMCLSETAGPSVCLDFDYQSNGDWSLVADANAVPFDYLRDILDLDLHFEQTLEGHMEWRQTHDKPPSGGADFRITAGRIMDLLDNEVLTTSKEGKFAFTLQNGNLESGVLDLEFPGTGFIDIDFAVLDIAGEDGQKLQGRAVTRLDSLTLVGQLALPRVDAVDGRFESDIQIGGNLKNPELDGEFSLANGRIEYTPAGFRLDDIDVRGRVQKRDAGDFKGSFRAGEGVASFDGHFLFDDAGSPQLTVDLHGGPLTLANTDTLKILAEPDLEAGFAPGRIDLDGRVTIPTASLTPATLEFEVVRDSEDLVVVSPETETARVPENASTVENSIFGQLEVALGDDVHVKVPGIETRITGSTTFSWSGDVMPMAQGGYNIRGKVDIYGPTLRISNGTVSFPGVPANSALLNIRAGRDIYGNTQIRSAGVQVIGNLKHPVLEAYTVPITSEDRAWTLLVTGTDFDQAQGVSGFDLGTYIAPKLYVSYGVSLFEDENVVSARYDLKKGFGVKVTSGQRETGLDVSYTINR